MTWFLTGTALGIWLFRKFISRQLAPYLPDKTTRHRVLTFIIIAFAITATVRLGARFVTG
ncbi:MAG: hypothetical protein ACRCUE_03950 [Bosea sp. (in: a-proteobacteria)]